MSIPLTGSPVAALPAVVAANVQGVGVNLTVREVNRTFLELDTPEGKLSNPSDIVRYVAGLVPEAKLLGAKEGDAAEVEKWLQFAYNDVLNAEVRGILDRDGQLLRALLNMGVFYSGLQESVRSSLQNCKSLAAALETLDKHLASEMFLVGGRITVADIAVASCLYDIHNLAYEKESVHHNVSRWFRTIVNQKEFQATYSLGLLTGGQVREGGQIDLRPNPAAVAADAERSKAINAGQKKHETQRQAEKKKKEKKEKKEEPKQEAKQETAATAETPGNGKVEPTAAQPESNLTPLGKEDAIAKVHGLLNKWSIAHTTSEHPEAPDVKTLLEVASHISGGHCKNLLLKAKKKKSPEDTRLWLLVALHDTPTDLKLVASKLGYGKIVIRFADDKTLKTNLGVAKGSVTPFALCNDTALQVNVAIDSRMLKEEKLNFHPLTNEATTTISPKDLMTFIDNTGHNVTVLDF